MKSDVVFVVFFLFQPVFPLGPTRKKGLKTPTTNHLRREEKKRERKKKREREERK
jgi:hypothetical protein